MVTYRGRDGQQSYHQTDELGDAIQFVEHLRNDESVDHARIFSMEELNFEFRPYYRVELAGTMAAAPVTVAMPAAPMEEEAPDVEEMDPLAAAWSATEPRDAAPVGAGMGRKGLFGR